MEFESFFGVPAHPLFVHLPVVLTPVAALTAVVLLFRSEWRRSFAWITALLAGAALFGAQLAVGSGEPLEEAVGESEGLERHAELGEVTRTFIAVFFVASVAVFVFDWWRARHPSEGKFIGNERIPILLLALTVVTGALSTVWVARTGHEGAKVTWERQLP